MNKTSSIHKLYEAAEQLGVAPVAAMFGNGLRVVIPMTQMLWDTTIDDLNLTVRARNGLMRTGADTIGKVADLIMHEDGLSKVRNLGRKSIAEIKTAILTEGYNHLDKQARLAFWKTFIEENHLT